MKRKNYNKIIAVLSVFVAILAAVCVGLALANSGILPSVMNKETTEQKDTTENTSFENQSDDNTKESLTSEPENVSESTSESASASTSEALTSAASTTAAPLNEKRYTTEELNVRTGAGTNFDKVGMLPKGSEVTVLREENGWSVIEYNGSERYVSSLYLAKTEQTTAASESVSATQQPADYTGVTSKGYKIETRNGVTYVDGVVIANKTYSVPKDYGSGLTGECSSAFNKMQAAAKSEGITLTIISGFRSYDTQNRLYNNYVAKDGKAKADTYSARPGTSEHQTGLAMDLNSLYTSFGDTKEGKWLADNCYKYGFIIRYPKGKESITGYIYEPWHVRYLGTDLATKVYNSGLCLEEYYGITSRYSD